MRVLLKILARRTKFGIVAILEDVPYSAFHNSLAGNELVLQATTDPLYRVRVGIRPLTNLLVTVAPPTSNPKPHTSRTCNHHTQTQPHLRHRLPHNSRTYAQRGPKRIVDVDTHNVGVLSSANRPRSIHSSEPKQLCLRGRHSSVLSKSSRQHPKLYRHLPIFRIGESTQWRRFVMAVVVQQARIPLPKPGAPRHGDFSIESIGMELGGELATDIRLVHGIFASG